MKNRSYDYYKHNKVNNLKEIMDLTIKRNNSNIAFSFFENEKIINKTYQEFYDEVIFLSNYLNHNYKKKHIAILSENNYKYIVLFFAIIISGNVAVVIDKELDNETIKQLLKNSDSNIMFYSSNFIDDLNIKIKKHHFLEIDKLINEGKKYSNKYKTNEDECATIFFTSGTTGANKGVMLSQKNIAYDVYASCSNFLLEGPTLCLLPFHHTFGLITSVIMPYYYGYPVFINSSLRRITQEIKIAKPDTLIVVPAFIENFYKQIWVTARRSKKAKLLKKSIKISNGLLKVGIDLRKTLFKSIHDTFGGNLNKIICGGAFLNQKYINWFRSIGIEILNGYGITECSPVVSVNRNKNYQDGSVGKLIKDCNVRIIDSEIVVNGDNVMLGYYKDKKSTSIVLDNNSFHTGDLGYIDENGFLFITGRKKNLIILSNGENISPEEIEKKLSKNKGICEIIVYEQNNQIIAEIYPEDEYIGDQKYFDNIIKKYNLSVPKNHQISYVKLRTSEFIKNNNKKILRNKIGEEYSNEKK